MVYKLCREWMVESECREFMYTGPPDMFVSSSIDIGTNDANELKPA